MRHKIAQILFQVLLLMNNSLIIVHDFALIIVIWGSPLRQGYSVQSDFLFSLVDYFGDHLLPQHRYSVLLGSVRFWSSPIWLIWWLDEGALSIIDSAAINVIWNIKFAATCNVLLWYLHDTIATSSIRLLLNVLMISHIDRVTWNLKKFMSTWARSEFNRLRANWFRGCEIIL